MTRLLQELHCLRARQRITYKLARTRPFGTPYSRSLLRLAGELIRVADIESPRRMWSATTARLGQRLRVPRRSCCSLEQSVIVSDIVALSGNFRTELLIVKIFPLVDSLCSHSVKCDLEVF